MSTKPEMENDPDRARLGGASDPDIRTDERLRGEVQLQIFQGKKSVASTNAHVVKLEHPLRENSVVVVPSNDGSRSIARINFGKRDFALELQNEGAD